MEPRDPATWTVCTCSGAAAAAAATGALTGSLGWKGDPRPSQDIGRAGRTAGGREGGGGDRRAGGDTDRWVGGGRTFRRTSVHLGATPAEPRGGRRRSVCPARYVGSEAQQPGGPFVLRGLPPQLPSIPLFIETKGRRDQKQKHRTSLSLSLSSQGSFHFRFEATWA